jgi:hypothetical protein
MNRVTSSRLAKYFCDTCTEYITMCMIMIYAASDTIWVMPPRLPTQRWGGYGLVQQSG